MVSCGRLVQLCTNYQQYKLNGVQIVVIPKIVNGTCPTTMYVLTALDREINPSTEIIVNCGKRIKNNKTTVIPVKVRGRQNDFTYWFDCEKMGTVDRRPTLQFSFTCDTVGQTVVGGYSIEILGNMSFRYPQYDSPNLSKTIDELKGKLELLMKEKEEEEKKKKEEEEKKKKLVLKDNKKEKKKKIIPIEDEEEIESLDESK